MLFFQVLPLQAENDATVFWWLKNLKALTHQKPPRRFVMFFFEALPFTTLASSVNGKTSKKSVLDTPNTAASFWHAFARVVNGKTSNKSMQNRRGVFWCVKALKA